MGLMAAEIVRFLQVAKMHGIKGKSVTMIGKQAISADLDVLLGAVSAMGIDYDKAIAKKIASSYRIDSYDFFRMLGFSEIHAVDYSDYEGADIILDLNSSHVLSEELRDAFDYVINGGTLEHIFDVAAAMENISQMLKQGGCVMHISPSEGWPNHGFYSISPTFFTDFYAINKHTVLSLEFEFVMSTPKNAAPSVCFSSDLRLLRDANRMKDYTKSFFRLPEFESALVVCIAIKSGPNGKMMYPTQGRYQNVYYEGASHKIPINSIYFDIAAKTVKEFEGRQAIYGCGTAGNLLLDELYKIGGERSVQTFFDGDSSKAGKNYRGLTVLYPIKEKLASFDRIVICSADYEGEIEASLLEKGVDPEKILKLSRFMKP